MEGGTDLRLLAAMMAVSALGGVMPEYRDTKKHAPIRRGPPNSVFRCVTCGDDIPPGRDGRRCKACRESQP